jgi:hypothetical protein
MNRPEISSRSGASLDICDFMGPDGGFYWTLIIKQRYRYSSRRTLPIAGAEVLPVDVPWPDAKAVQVPSDYCLIKPSTDIVVAGHAVAPAEVPEFDAMIRVDGTEGAIHVTGPRLWYSSLGAWFVTPPRPVSRVPVMWDLAWGGSDLENPKRPAMERRNPIGRGVVRDLDVLEKAFAPQIEQVGRPIRSPRDNHVPAGLGAIGADFAPRQGYAGTYDDEWVATRMPRPPADFDMRFNSVAPPWLVTPKHLRGGERVQMLNLGRPGAIEFTVPNTVYGVTAIKDSERGELRPQLDTAVFLVDEAAVDLTYRVSIPQERRAPVRALHVFEKERI